MSDLITLAELYHQMQGTTAVLELIVDAVSRDPQAPAVTVALPPSLVATIDQLQAAVTRLTTIASVRPPAPTVSIPEPNIEPLLAVVASLQDAITALPDAVGKRLHIRMAGGGGGGATTDPTVSAKLTDLIDRTPDITGTWDYRSGTSGSVSIPASGRVLSAAAVATSGAGTVTINAGDSIAIPEDVGWDHEPKANLVAPTYLFTGTDSYFVEFVT